MPKSLDNVGLMIFPGLQLAIQSDAHPCANQPQSVPYYASTVKYQIGTTFDNTYNDGAGTLITTSPMVQAVGWGTTTSSKVALHNKGGQGSYAAEVITKAQATLAATTNLRYKRHHLSQRRRLRRHADATERPEFQGGEPVQPGDDGGPDGHDGGHHGLFSCLWRFHQSRCWRASSSGVKDDFRPSAVPARPCRRSRPTRPSSTRPIRLSDHGLDERVSQLPTVFQAISRPWRARPSRACCRSSPQTACATYAALGGPEPQGLAVLVATTRNTLIL